MALLDKHNIPSPFDSRVAFSVIHSELGEPCSLLPEELVLISASASTKRRAEVTQGRTAARNALAQLGFAVPAPILRGDRGQPLFPEGYRGSISHCEGIAIAAVATANSLESLGVDIQRKSARFSRELSQQFASESESEWIHEFESLRIQRACAIFSAKESIFKALYPIVQSWFGFDGAVLDSIDSENFEARVRPFRKTPQHEYRLNVRVKETSEFIVTGVAFEHSMVKYDIR